MRVRGNKRTRAKERPKKRAARVFGFTVKLLCLIAVPAVGAYALRDHLGTERYTVRDVVVDGTRFLDPGAVVLQSGVTNQDLLLLVDVSEVATRVEQMPYVKECWATREFPDTVYVFVTERVAVATLLINNNCYAIDEECVVLRELAQGEAYPGPLITSVPNLVSVAEGQQLEQEELKAALAVWRAWSTTQIAQEVAVSEIAARHVNDIRMYCEELPFELRWGREDFEAQGRRLDIVWEAKGKQLPCREYLDLRFGRDLAWK